METPADVAHGGLTTAGTGQDIDPKALKKDILRGVFGKASLECLPPLKSKQDPEFLFSDRVRQKTKVSDLLKTLWEDVHQESADKLIMRERHFLACIFVPVVTIPERNGIVRDEKDAAVGDGHAMCITAKIIDRVAQAIEGLFDVGTPVGAVKPVNKGQPVEMFIWI